MFLTKQPVSFPLDVQESLISNCLTLHQSYLVILCFYKLACTNHSDGKINKEHYDLIINTFNSGPTVCCMSASVAFFKKWKHLFTSLLFVKLKVILQKCSLQAQHSKTVLFKRPDVECEIVSLQIADECV